MQLRSNLWKELAASGNVRLETSVTIGGRTYAPASAVAVERAIGQAALSCGNCVSATARFSLAAADMEGAAIPGASAAVVKCRFVDGERVSEWLAVGTFRVTRRQNNPVNGQLEFEGFDAMQKANAPYPSLSGFPKAMNSAVMEIAHNMGVEIDGRTWNGFPAGGDYRVPLPADGEKMIKVLGYIGGVCGGNWVITPRNRLRLVPFASASGAASATDKAEIAGVMGGVTTGAALSVTGAEATTGSARYFAGTDAGGIVSVPSNPYAKQALVNALLTKYNGLSYVPFEIKGGIYDPATEIGDYIISRQDIAGVICKESARYAPAFRGDLSAPFAFETSETERSLSDAIGDSGAVTEDLSVRIYKFVSQSAVTVGDGQSAEIINFDYAAGEGQDVIFHAEIKHTTETTETGNATDGWSYTDAVITATYYINGKAVDSYRPVKTETDGANLLHLTYHFTNGRFNAGNFRVALSLSGGSVTIAAGDANACIIGQGYSGTDDNWVMEDGLVFIGAESYPETMNYAVGDALDLTGLVVKAYYADGREKDVTAQCSVNPAAGTAFGAEGETVVSLSYMEDGAEFRDSFSVYCDRDGYGIMYIEALEPPTKTEYLRGERLSLDGLVVGAFQENGHVIVNIKPECRFNPAEGDALTETGTVTVTVTRTYGEILGYGTFTAYFDVNVSEDSIIVKVRGDGWTLYDNGVLYIYSDSAMPRGEAGFCEWYSHKDNITAIAIDDSVTSIGVFLSYNNLINATIGNGITSIGDNAFRDCPSLTSVTIGNSVTSIGESAFNGCASLTSVTIPASLTSVGAWAFSDCGALTSVTLPASVTSIGNGAFQACGTLTSVVIPEGVTSIGEYTFSRCRTLTSVTIPNSVASIGESAFYACLALTSVTIPDSVTSIADSAFSHCHSLSNVTIGNSVTNIEPRVFFYCYNLISVTIPDSVASIGWNAFGYCDSLTDVYYGGTEEQWNAIAIDSENNALTSANIHYNSAGPE